MKCACQSRSKWMTLGVLLSAATAVAVLAGSPVSSSPEINWNTGDAATHSVQKVALPEIDSTSRRHASLLSQAFRDASTAVLPSVVTIQSSGAAVSSDLNGGSNQRIPESLKNDPFFRKFFEGMPEGHQQQRSPKGRSGMGSGVIVDSSGIILTNNHVVEGAGKLLVKLHDGREYEATEWKTDPSTDIAVVRIDTDSELPAARIGDSDSMLVGDWVLAVGAPFGLNETVTTGIVSAKSRGIGITDREDFIQTDAAINPGNSGGPLVNLDGEVIGINTAISSTTGGYQGIGFAVPINLARWIGDQLIENGTVRRAFLGVGIQPVTSELSEQFGLDAVRGAVVTDVREGTPARKAGVKTGDVIVRFNDRDIRTPRDLQGAVERAALDRTHQMVVIRDGSEVQLSVDVTAMPEQLAAAESQSEQPADGSESRFNSIGLEVSNLTGDVADQLSVESNDGVVITGVKSGSPAAAAGLREGLVISMVGRKRITSVADFRAALDVFESEGRVMLLVRSGEASRFVVVQK